MVVSRALISALVMACLLAALGVWAAMASRPHELIEIHSTRIPLDQRELADRADTVAILVSTGRSDVHWNSADRERWESASGEQPALIVRDDEFRVDQVLFGEINQELLTVRGVGGTIEDVTMTYSGQTDWQSGTAYLVFLRQSDTPTREGSELAWTEVDIGQSAFIRSGGHWANDRGLTIDEPAVESSFRD